MNAIETLISVLCDPEGKCCISGSDDDRRLIDSALAELAQAAQAAEIVPAPAPPPECETEAEKRAFAFGWFKALESERMKADSVLEDAARYRLVRRGQHWSVINGIGNGLRAEELDAAVDAARAAQERARAMADTAPLTPTDAELWQLHMQMPGRHKDPIDFARAVLARWGTPAPVEPVAVVVPCYTPSGKRVALYSAKQDLPIGTQLYTAPQPVERAPLPGIKPGDFFGGRPEYAMEIDPDDFYGITEAIHHAIEMLNTHKDANTDWSPLDPKRSRRLQQALMAAWILEYPKEAAAHGIKGCQHGAE